MREPFMQRELFEVSNPKKGLRVKYFSGVREIHA